MKDGRGKHAALAARLEAERVAKLAALRELMIRTPARKTLAQTKGRPDKLDRSY